jgi:hypothetical protein
MTWNFDDLVKGHVTQTLLSTMLERVGYAVHRLGVEEILPELRGPNSAKIRKHLPKRLRFLPDLLVTDPEGGEVFLVEVKFRVSASRKVFDSLLDEVEERRQYWPEAHTIILRAESLREEPFHQNHIRVISPELSIAQIRTFSSPFLLDRWESLPQIQEVFHHIFGDFKNQQIADSITQVLRDLSKLEPPN